MDLRPHKLDTVQEEGWHIISDDWWYTLYDSIPWTFPQEITGGVATNSSPFCGSLFGTRSASCPSQAFSGRRRNTCNTPTGDLTLRCDLSGVQCALDTIATYEADVGIISGEVMSDVGRRRIDISVEVAEEEVARGRMIWNEYVETLMDDSDSMSKGDVVDDELSLGDVTRVSSPTSSQGGLHRSTSTLSSVDLTDSDLSFKSTSLPSTPKGRSHESMVEINDASPLKGSKSQGIYPGRPLNACASSFVPTFSKANAEPFTLSTPTGQLRNSTRQTAFVNFTFPSLEVPPLPTVKIKKDEQGFYSEAEVAAPVPQTQRAACTFLPLFLQDASRRRAPASKTRAMVDRLRSAHNHSHSPSPNPPLYDMNLFDERVSVSEDDRPRNSGMSSPSSQEEDEDGWINLAEVDNSSQESKARRTRDLFLALTRRRSDSTPPNQNVEDTIEDHPELEIPMTSSPSPSPSPLTMTEDGWIEGPSISPSTDATPQQRRTGSRSRSHRKRRLSQAPSVSPSIPSHSMPSTTLRAPAGIPHPSFHPAAPHFPSQAPASYYYAAYPSMMSPVAYTSYMQQLHLMQMQMRSRSAGGGRRSIGPHSTPEWFQYPASGAKPFTTANTPVPMVSTPASRRDSLW